jgi:hypothetical protein
MSLHHCNQYSNCINKQPLTPEDIRKIGSALGKPKAYRDGYICCCPTHEDNNPSLSIWLSGEYSLGLKCYADCKPDVVYNEIKSRGLLPHNRMGTSRLQNEHVSKRFTPKSSSAIILKKPTDNEYNLKYAKDIWAQSANSLSSPVETYLRSRGIQGDIPSTIRYISDAKHKPTGKCYPCMISAIMRWPDSQIIGVHRTFLSSDGKSKALVEPNKMMLGNVSGGAVRLTLAPAREVLVVGEGLETMLSFIGMYPEYAIWAVLSASNLESLVLPELPLASTIIIAADNDNNDKGLKAAKLAAKKWSSQGRTVKIALPPEKGTDFNSVLMGELA